MPGWLENILDLAEKLLPAPISHVISGTIGGILSVLNAVTGNVTGAWHELAIAFDALRAGHFELLTTLENVLASIIGHWIPHYAITAWWWVTHPDQLAQQLSLYTVKWLEQQAWTIAPYLGRFVLALIVRNVRRWLPVVEHIITAIL